MLLYIDAADGSINKWWTGPPSLEVEATALRAAAMYIVRCAQGLEMNDLTPPFENVVCDGCAIQSFRNAKKRIIGSHRASESSISSGSHGFSSESPLSTDSRRDSTSSLSLKGNLKRVDGEQKPGLFRRLSSSSLRKVAPSAGTVEDETIPRPKLSRRVSFSDERARRVSFSDESSPRQSPVFLASPPPRSLRA